MTTTAEAAAHPWPHLSTTHAELRFEHHSDDPRGGDLRGCLVVRPPAGKVVHLGLSRPMIAAEELLEVAKAVEAWLDGDVAGVAMPPKLARLAQAWARGQFGEKLRAAIAKAGG
jgi:hypothetical protein